MTAKDLAPIVVLGGGVCGLYAARTLARNGTPVVLIEKDEEVGGLAAGHAHDGNFYDLGVHHLHAHDQEIFDDIKSIMGDELIPCKKVALVKYGKGFQRYPLEFYDLIKGIPFWFLAFALLGLIWQQIKNKIFGTKAKNAEEALIELYGAPLYRFFFRDFTARYWGIPPKSLSASFVRRKMPRLSAIDVIKKALGRFGFKEQEDAAVDSATREETIWFSEEGSRAMPRAIARQIEQDGGTVLCGYEVEKVLVDGKKVVGIEATNGTTTKEIACSACLSTIPVNLLASAIHSTDGSSLASSDSKNEPKLRFRQILVLGFLVKRQSLLNALYIYYRNRSFTRISEPSRSGLKVNPAGHSILLVEMTCEEGDEAWNGGKTLHEKVIRELEEEQVLTEDEIVDIFTLRSKHGYPIFEFGFEDELSEIQDYLGQFENLQSTGRQGAFCYPNMHESMRMGKYSAEILDASCNQT